MKYSKENVIRDSLFVVRRRNFLLFIIFLLLGFFLITSSYELQAMGYDSRSTIHDSQLTTHDSRSLKAPIQETESQENLPSQVDLNTIPNFPRFGAATDGNRISASDTNIPLNTSLKLSVDNFLDSKTAKVGDYFKAHVLEDFYISTDTPQLLLPKGSWVRGRISLLKRPNFFIKSAKITIHLDQVVTPLGDTVVLDAEMDIQKGILGQNGLLRPIIAKPSEQEILFNTNVPVPISNLGPSLVGDLLTGKLYALLPQNEIITINKGQELQIVLSRNIQLTAN